jgi:hypothetical protein
MAYLYLGRLVGHDPIFRFLETGIPSFIRGIEPLGRLSVRRSERFTDNQPRWLPKLEGYTVTARINKTIGFLVENMGTMHRNLNIKSFNAHMIFFY